MKTLGSVILGHVRILIHSVVRSRAGKCSRFPAVSGTAGHRQATLREREVAKGPHGARRQVSSRRRIGRRLKAGGVDTDARSGFGSASRRCGRNMIVTSFTGITDEALYITIRRIFKNTG